MLRKLLRLTRDRSTIDNAALARDLGVSIDGVRQMIQQLEQLGYLERTVLGCTQPCQHCSLQPTCPSSHASRLWHITDKGEKSLSSD
jgi:DeoR/GlpR family transcriptional regulator of sugar metabolism